MHPSMFIELYILELVWVKINADSFNDLINFVSHKSIFFSKLSITRALSSSKEQLLIFSDLVIPGSM